MNKKTQQEPVQESDKERIDRLERMIKTLAETCGSLVSVVNTGSYEYSLSDVRSRLRNVEEYTRSKS